MSPKYHLNMADQAHMPQVNRRAQAQAVRRAAREGKPMMHYVEGEMPPNVARNFELLYLQNSGTAAEEARKRLPETLLTDPMHACRIAITLATNSGVREKFDFVEFVKGLSDTHRRVAIKALKGSDNSVVRRMAEELYTAIPDLPPTLLHMTSTKVIAHLRHHFFQSPPPRGLNWKKIMADHPNMFFHWEAVEMDNSIDVRMRDYWIEKRLQQLANNILCHQDWRSYEDKRKLLDEYTRLIEMKSMRERINEAYGY